MEESTRKSFKVCGGRLSISLASRMCWMALESILKPNKNFFEARNEQQGRKNLKTKPI